MADVDWLVREMKKTNINKIRFTRLLRLIGKSETVARLSRFVKNRFG
jgi:hypothetical protein